VRVGARLHAIEPVPVGVCVAEAVGEKGTRPRSLGEAVTSRRFLRRESANQRCSLPSF
jgi:hypothetical protein